MGTYVSLSFKDIVDFPALVSVLGGDQAVHGRKINSYFRRRLNPIAPVVVRMGRE